MSLERQSAMGRRDGAQRRWLWAVLLVLFCVGAGVAAAARSPLRAAADPPEADLFIIKTGQSWQWPERTPFRYHLWVRNDGPDVAVDTLVTDSLPGGMSFASANYPCVGGFTVTCNLGNIPANSSVDLYLDVITPEVFGDPTYVTNYASVTSSTPDPNPGAGNQSEDTTQIQDVHTDLYVDASGPSSATAGTEITYTVLVLGDPDWTAHDVFLEEHLPDSVAFVSVDQPCTVDGNHLTCAIGDLGPNQTRTYHVTGSIPIWMNGVISDVAVVHSSTEDPYVANNTDSVETSVEPQRTDLSVQLSGPAEAVAGSDLTYTIALTNNGDWPARHVDLADDPPDFALLIGSDANCGGTWEIRCDPFDVPPHSTRLVHLTFRLGTSDFGSLPSAQLNRAWFSMDTLDTDGSNNADTIDLTVLPTVPTAPVDVTGSPGDVGSVNVTWGRPDWDGGSYVGSYRVTASPGGAWQDSTSQWATVSGLTPGVAYTFTVRAANVAGWGPWSAPSAPVVPVGPPQSPPTNVLASAGDGEATVAWTAPVNSGGTWLTGYTVVSSPGGIEVTVGGESALVTGLTNGTVYRFRVFASNSYGDGPWSALSNAVTPLGLPGPPTGVVAAAGNASASLLWTAPANDGGSPIIGYSIRVLPDGYQVDRSGSPAVLTGLSNGSTYSFQVAARNDLGLGPWSATSNEVVPQSLPGPPEWVDATAGDRQAEVRWGQPVDNGGHPVSGYLVTIVPGGASVTVPSSPTTITALTNGVPYTFAVQAVTTVGTGPMALSPTVTPAGLPGRPTGVSGSPLVGGVELRWDPVDGNGSPIGHHEVETQPGGVTHVAGSPAVIDHLSPLTAYTFRVRAVNGVGAGAWSDASSPVIPSAPPARFFTLPNPVRILDTREGPVPDGYPVGEKLGGGSSLDLQVAGVAGVPTDASAVVLNMTAVFPTAASHLTVWPTGQDMPTASSLNFRTGEIVANLVIVKLGDGGRVSIYDNSGAVHVVADVTGYDADDGSGSLLTAVQPRRLLDSREGIGGPATPWGPASTRTLTVTGGVTSVPTGATAVVLNVTGVFPTAGTHLTVWPTGQSMPLASNLNLPTGDIRPNLVMVKVGTSGRISIYNNSGTMHVLADVVGYFDQAAGGGLFTGVQPARLLDSREGIGGPATPWGPAEARTLTVTGGDTTVPTGATAVVLNITGVLPTAGTHLTVWPTGQVMPVASNLNLPASGVRPNLVVVKVGTSGRISIYNNSGSMHVVADVVGYYGVPVG